MPLIDVVPGVPFGFVADDSEEAEAGAYADDTKQSKRTRKPKPIPYTETPPMLAGNGTGFERVRALGRNTADTINSAEHWQQIIPEAPFWFSDGSDKVEVSPPIYRYCPGGFDHQWIGMCVGKATKNAIATVARIPAGATWDAAKPDEFTEPLENLRLSGLWCYLNARTIHGRAGFGEGAVVAYSLDGILKKGFLLERYWEDTQANQRAYSDRSNPGSEAEQWAAQHVLQGGYAARITSAKQYLDMLAAGFPIVDGVEIGTGWMNTNDQGAFSLGGRVVGGHATVTVGYDKKLNRLYKRNSWLGWGRKTDNPEFGASCQYRDNIGYCSLDEYVDRNLSDSLLRSGRTDAFVINDVPWDRGPVDPKIKLISSAELFT